MRIPACIARPVLDLTRNVLAAWFRNDASAEGIDGRLAAVAAAASLQRKSVPSSHIRCMVIASLRDTDTVAFFIPLRLQMRKPQASKGQDLRYRRSSSEPAALLERLACLAITALRHPLGEVDFAGRPNHAPLQQLPRPFVAADMPNLW